jgi:hypothetical protein
MPAGRSLDEDQQLGSTVDGRLQRVSAPTIPPFLNPPIKPAGVPTWLPGLRWVGRPLGDQPRQPLNTRLAEVGRQGVLDGRVCCRCGNLLAVNETATVTDAGRIDLFVSHAGRDRAWAECVAWELKQAGYRVELDFWDWEVGENFVEKMRDALERADRIVALFSEAYFEAERYTTVEWTALLTDRDASTAAIAVPD